MGLYVTYIRKWLGYKMLEKPVKNDPQHPLCVWTLVRKPLGLTA